MPPQIPVSFCFLVRAWVVLALRTASARLSRVSLATVPGVANS